MEFLRQIKNEIKNIFSSKFILVFAILVLLGSIAVPVITALSPTPEYSVGPGGPIMYTRAEVAYDKIAPPYDGGTGQDPIQVGDITVTSDNPFYWQLSSILQEQAYLQTDSSMFTSPQVLDLVLELLDTELNYYASFAANVTTYEDYRYELGYTGTSALYDQFIYTRVDTADHEVLREAANYRMYMEPEAFDAKYYDISPTDRLAALDAAEAKLDTLNNVVKNNDFSGYIDLMIGQQNQSITDLESQIEVYEETLREHPEQEEMLNANIESCQKQIELIQTSTIPWLEFRREKNIIPYTDMWQNTALNDITNSQSQLQYFYIMTEEEFNRDTWSATQYGTYANYLEAMNKQKDELNNTILIADRCLKSDRPDMKYVPDGARNITVNFLDYSVIIAIFAILLGGWLIASEFQLGTIRLLMIRPRTRTKILMSKFLGALIIALGMYLVCAVLNILMNGILFGFGDFGFPNFTVSGEVGFFGYFLPRFLACSITIIFAFCVAFMLSVLVKNIAVSIAVPIVCYVGCYILMALMVFRGAGWLTWTPIPYVQISSFYVQVSSVKTMMQMGVPMHLTYGIIMLSVFSIACAVISVLAFRKKDITH